MDDMKSTNASDIIGSFDNGDTVDKQLSAAQMINRKRNIEDIVRQSDELKSDGEDTASGLSVMSWLVQTGELLPPWWSKARDKRLSNIWMDNNHLSLAIYNTQAKLVGIPFKVVPYDYSNQDHVQEAVEVQYALEVTAQFGRGWSEAYSRFILDLLTTDNGAFMEIIGRGRPDGPIIGKPLTVRHIDSLRCDRTGDNEYPIIYNGNDGKMYKMHWTRVLFTSQMPSARQEMFGVGFCGVSRCIDVATTLVDMVRYKQERLGSRPMNQILVGKGMTAHTIMDAIARVEDGLSSRGFSRYAKTVALGSENPDIDLTRVDLSHKDPFDEEVNTNLGMFAIAAALGMDADEIWPTSGRSGGGSSGDANLRRIRSRGRLPQQLTANISTQFDFKFLPPYLHMVFDFRDDEQDQQEAVIKDIRGRNRERDLGTGSINVRGARIQMLTDSDIAQATFDQMELSDGRLPDGTSVSALFFDSDPVFVKFLRFMQHPLQIVNNTRGSETDPFTGEKVSATDDSKVDDIVGNIQAQREVVLTELMATSSSRTKNKLQACFFALDWLEEQYNMVAGRVLPQVPMQRRSSRTDIRVVPEELSPSGQSAAALNQGSPNTASENVAQDER